MLILAQSFESPTRRCHSHRSTGLARHGKTPYPQSPPNMQAAMVATPIALRVLWGRRVGDDSGLKIRVSFS